MKTTLNLHKLAMGLSVMGLLLLWGPVAHAAETTVIDGPGFQVEQRKGWFGRSEQRYRDALGNTVVRKKGWFGRPTQEVKIQGAQVQRRGDNVSVTLPDGTPLVTRKKRWFGRTETRVNGQGVWKNLKDAFRE